MAAPRAVISLKSGQTAMEGMDVTMHDKKICSNNVMLLEYQLHVHVLLLLEVLTNINSQDVCQQLQH